MADGVTTIPTLIETQPIDSKQAIIEYLLLTATRAVSLRLVWVLNHRPPPLLISTKPAAHAPKVPPAFHAVIDPPSTRQFPLRAH